jgi:NAD(P)-dependent dehydrogenase (short-subunit alcohol dehydrogenase family)
MQELKGKTVLVTGSTDGVGRLVATKLGEAGAQVLVHGRNKERGEQVVSEIGQRGGMTELVIADLASLAEVGKLAEIVSKKTDRLDVLINNAGVGTGGPGGKRQTSADGHELRFAVNYLAGYRTISAAFALERRPRFFRVRARFAAALASFALFFGSFVQCIRISSLRLD